MDWRIRLTAAVPLLFLHGLVVFSAHAQTLEEKLVAEDSFQLAKEARNSGNVVRGAILFHQGNINCSKCHKPAAGGNQIGPNLASLNKDVDDQSIIESILKPSKQISKGYETLIVLTSDGRTLSGIKVKEDTRSITLCDKDDVNNSTEISREEIDEMRMADTSSMPAGLANELKSRQQFLDLLRYVFELRDRDVQKVSESTGFAKRELNSSLAGLVLIQKYNCVACHDMSSNFTELKPKHAPNLSWSAENLNPNYISTFVSDPLKTKRGTTMPDLLGHLDLKEKQLTAKSITHFLAKKYRNKFNAGKMDSVAAERGFELFHSVGCVACHSPRNTFAIEEQLSDSTPMGPLYSKYDLNGLIEFLKDPLRVRSSGHMPNMQLTHFEASDISAFLLQAQEVGADEWQIDETLVAKGLEKFKELNCSSCHEGVLPQSNSSGISKAISDLKPDQGCLSESRGNWPNFHFDGSDREAILDFLRDPPKQTDPQQNIDMMLTAFNCVACHDRNGLGGVPPSRSHHFATTNLNLGDQGRVPPTLTGVGAKLKPKWLRDVMVNARSIRPYMKTRMPQFGEANVKPLISLFASTDKLPIIEFAEYEDQKTMREQGHVLAGNKGLNCVACHTYQYKISDTMPAVDLTEMAERLDKQWFYQYMLDPQKFSPNTVMPSFWPEGKAIRGDIQGTPEDQIEAIWQYLLDGRQARAPAGVVRKPLEIVVSKEAKMLRRKYPGIGKRGIGVGYPNGINIAFDAEQLRLASIWRGKFVEASGVWRGQGSGNARPLGRPLNFGKGPNVDSMDSPWIVGDGRPSKHQFKGYALDKLRRPTFRYTFDSINVQDFPSTFEDADGKTQLRRNIRLTSKTSRDDLSFSIRSEEKIVSNENRIQIGDRLTVLVKSPLAVRVSELENDYLVSIPIELKAEQTQELTLEYIMN